jgi:hypothetical protein
MASSTVNLKALGLNFSPNPLELPPGSLIQADNVIIRRDNVVESRRGFKLYGEEIPEEELAKQILVYRDRILRHYSDRIEFQDGILNNGDVKFTLFGGNFLETKPGLRIKSIQAQNGNMYFTSIDGIKKISASTADDFVSANESSPDEENYITQAGAIKALDLNGDLIIKAEDQSSFLGENEAVAYKIVWGNTDANNVELLGTPSERIVIRNPGGQLIRNDFQRLLTSLDNLKNNSGSGGPSSLISDGDYVDDLAVPSSDSLFYVRENIVELATKVDEDLVFASGNGTGLAYESLQITSVSINLGIVTITFSTSTASDYFSVGDLVNLKDFKSNSVDIEFLNGNQIIQEVNSNNIIFTAREYSEANSAGISGFIKSNTATTGGKVTITTDKPHGLADGQEIIITNTGQSALDGTTFSISVSGTETFIISAAGVVVGSIGVWDIKSSVLATSTIESYKYRSITPPVEISITEPNGTASQVSALRSYLTAIIDNLKSEKSGVIGSVLSERAGLKEFTSTTKASVRLEFTVPIGITQGYFYRVYRSEIVQAQLTDDPELIEPPTDYFFLTQENYTSKTDRQTIIYYDQLPLTIDPFNSSLKLYTSNSATGDQDPNDYPPFAHDISLFTDYAIYASTKLKQLRGMTLLGTTLIRDSITPLQKPKLFIGDETGNNQNVYEFVNGKQQVVTITPTPSSGVLNSTVIEKYFTIQSIGQSVVNNNNNNQYTYCFWYSDGSTIQPTVTNVDEFIEIYIDNGTSIDQFLKKTNAALNSVGSAFSSSLASNILTIKYLTDGEADPPVGSASFPATFSITTYGIGEDIDSKKVALPSNPLLTPEQQTILTIKSLARIINRTTSNQDSLSDVYCYYDSQLQGDFTLEGIFFKDDPFYVSANVAGLGNSFTPSILSLNGSSCGNSGSPLADITLVFSSAHGFLNNDKIILFNIQNDPTFYGVFEVKYVDSLTLKIQNQLLSVSPGGTFSYVNAKNSLKSDNYKRKNRLYYSKAGIPEAVYNNVFLGSFQDIGSEEKEILRVIPLRESLFVFKEDGLYRLSGFTAPFNEALFDSSCILTAPDSVAISGNVIYAWTRQGITVISESGTSIVSRPIDTEILKLGSSNYTNFKTSTFGVGYESDNSYIVWTVSKVTDTVATQAFRYSSLTGSWTKYTKTNTCGLVNSVDDTMYLGAGDVPFLEQERKKFTREDYADREFLFNLGQGAINGSVINLSDLGNVQVGDSFVQTQILNIYHFNSLLKKLDSDPQIKSASKDDFSTLEMTSGENLRIKITELAAKLDDLGTTDYSSSIDSKSGTFSLEDISFEYPLVITSTNHGLFTGRVISISNAISSPDLNGEYMVTVIDEDTFTIDIELDSLENSPTDAVVWVTSIQNIVDISSCYNKLVELINLDTAVSYSNYQPIDYISTVESSIVEVNRINKTITLRRSLPFVQGEVKTFQAIDNVVTYAPNTFGDALSVKHIREATAMFSSKAFTSGIMSFSTDLLPGFVDVSFTGDGKGLFGNDDFGENFFGGVSNSIPFRTYVPRNCQRCRFLNLKFTHRNAREEYSLLGITLTGRSVSTRAYR